MKKSFAAAFIVAGVMSTASALEADSLGMTTLSAAQEVNPVTMMPPASSATGTFSLSLNAAGDTLAYTLSYSGLTSDVTMAHIHYGPPGLTGAPIFALFDYGVPPSMAKTSDTVSGTLTVANFAPDSADGITTFSQAIAAIEAGNTYVNVHSLNYLAGEIRGQFPSTASVGGGTGNAAAPEPASAGLFLGSGIAFGAAGLLRRKRRAA